MKKQKTIGFVAQTSKNTITFYDQNGQPYLYKNGPYILQGYTSTTVTALSGKTLYVWGPNGNTISHKRLP